MYKSILDKIKLLNNFNFTAGCKRNINTIHALYAFLKPIKFIYIMTIYFEKRTDVVAN